MPQFKKGDYGFDVTFTVYEKKNTVKDLTSITGVAWQFKDTKTGTTKSITGAKVAPDTSGKVKFTVPQNHFDTVTTYESEIELTSGASKENTDSFPVEVVDPAL